MTEDERLVRRRQKCREYSRRYRATPAGRAATQAYVKSEHGKQLQKKRRERYLRTPKGKAYLARAKQRSKAWSQSQSGLRWREQYECDPVRRAAKVRNQRRYSLTPKGQLACINGQRAYRATENGRASQLRSAHKRRSRIKRAPSSLTTTEWKAVLARCQHRCLYCGEAKALERDHIVPVSRGGGLTAENVAPACRRCNTRKGTQPIEIFLCQIPADQQARARRLLTSIMER